MIDQTLSTATASACSGDQLEHGSPNSGQVLAGVPVGLESRGRALVLAAAACCPRGCGSLGEIAGRLANDSGARRLIADLCDSHVRPDDRVAIATILGSTDVV